VLRKGLFPACLLAPIRWSLWCVLVLTTLVVVWVGWTTVRVFLMMHPQHVDLDELESLTGIEFPSSARVVASEFQDVPRAMLEAKVYIDRRDALHFRASEPFGGRWIEGMPTWATAHGHWWEPPANARGVWHTSVAAPGRTPEPPRQRLLVVHVALLIMDTDSAIVYVRAAGS